MPFIAGFFELAVAIVMMLLGGFDILTDMLVFVIWIFYTLVFMAVIKLRKTEPDLPRPYKVPLYPFIPIVSIIGGIFILSMTLINQLSLVVIGLGLTALGIPFYIFANRKRN